MKLPKVLSTNKNSNIDEIVNDIEKTKLILPNVKPFSYSFSDFEDEKAYRRYIKSCESLIRNSIEYRSYLRYLKETQNLHKCTFLSNIDLNNINKVGLELHHYPFNLFELVDIIIKKQTNFYKNPTSTFMICNEVMKLHFENLIGVVPLTKTIHELAHSGEIFINLNLVYGNVEKFIEQYKSYISDDLFNSLNTLSKLSEKPNLQTNKFILKKKFQEIVSSEKRDLKPIISQSEEIKLA